MYFDAAEQKIAELESRIAAMEAAEPPTVDLTPIQSDVAALKEVAVQLQAAVDALDKRLDAIASGAQG